MDAPKEILIAPPAFDPVVYYGILGMACIVSLLTAFLFSRYDRKSGIVYILSTTILALTASLLSSQGFFSRFDLSPPPFLIVIILFFLGPIVLGLSSYGKVVSSKVPIFTLICIQSFRFPLELIMHRAAELKIMPIQLSYSGWNFDILTGLSAIFIGIALIKKKQSLQKIVFLWNIWGSFCLFAIAIIAITTSPILHLFGTEAGNINTWVLYFPYILLPGLLVTNAIFCHVIIFRKLN